MTSKNNICNTVEQIYEWLDGEIEKHNPACDACGDCCDFESFGHRLFVTTVEIIYLEKNLPAEKQKKMTTPQCPYNQAGKCTIRNFRFAACRIFFCKGDSEFQSRISEETLGKLKTLCTQGNLPYRYTDLKKALS